MVYFGIKDGTKTHRLYDPQHEKIHINRDVVFEEEKKWDWCSIGDNKQTITEFTTLEEEGDATDLESVSTATPISPHMSSPMTLNGVMDYLEQESSGESTRRSKTKDGPKNFRSLAKIYADSLEEELDLNELVLLTVKDPTTYHEAAIETIWQEVIQKELEAIEKNKTWALTNLPSRHKPISLKWVFKLKKNSEENVIKHKARLVVKGYVQRQGVDFEEVFAPVARLDIVRLILALTFHHGWEVHHLDVKLALLNGDL